MSILSNYFDKIYCINLDRRKDRWGKVSKTFDELGFDDVERYSAIDGKTLDLSQLEYKKSLLVGELGILETHRKLIKESKENNLNTILIMEDDVTFNNNITKLDEFMSAVPNDWDMLFFGGNHVYGKQPTKINDKILKLNYTVALHCVAVKNTLFDHLLEITKRRNKQIDQSYADLQKVFNAYSFTPNMASQYTDYSDIQNRITNYSAFFKN